MKNIFLICNLELIFLQNQKMNQYGAENVYGYGGRGTVPTSVEWGI